MFSSLDILVCIIFMLYIVNITRVNAQLCKLIKDRMLNVAQILFMEKLGFCRFDEAKFKTFFETKQRNLRNRLKGTQCKSQLQTMSC